MSERIERPSEVLARQVRIWRDRRRLSAQGLAARLSALGAKLPRVAISKIENGDRGVSVDEWLQLAHALAVPPPLLLVDLEAGAEVEIAPAATLHPWLAWEWMVGESPPTMTDRTVTRVQEFSHATHAIALYRRERKAAEAVHTAESEISAAEYAKDEARLQHARTQHAEALADLARCLDDMLEADIVPPAKPRAWIATMRKLNLLRYPDHMPVMEAKEAKRGRR